MNKLALLLSVIELLCFFLFAVGLFICTLLPTNYMDFENMRISLFTLAFLAIYARLIRMEG